MINCNFLNLFKSATALITSQVWIKSIETSHTSHNLAGFWSDSGQVFFQLLSLSLNSSRFPSNPHCYIFLNANRVNRLIMNYFPYITVE